ncbi:MAG: lipopolysaccharide biosynthesis protein [Luteimonas sp.]
MSEPFLPKPGVALGGTRSISRRLGSNVLGYGYYQVVTLVVQLVLVPFYLKFWGTALYADWLVLSGIPTMLLLLDFGVGQATANKATMLAASGDYVGVRRSLQTAFAFALCTCAMIFVLVNVFAGLVDLGRLFHLSRITSHDAKTLVILLATNLCVGLFAETSGAWFRAIDRAASGAFLLANRRLIDVGISITVLTFGGTPVVLAAAILLGQVCMLVALLATAKRWSPWPILGFRHASWEEFTSVWKPALGYLGIPIAQVIILQGGLQTLNHIASPAAVVAFTMSRTLMRLVIQVGVVTSQALRPELSRLAGAGKYLEARSLTTRASLLVLGAGVFGYGMLVLIGPDVIALWGRGSVAVSHVQLALVGLHSVLNLAWFVPAALLISTNTHARVGAFYSLASASCLLVWLACVRLIPGTVGASLLLAMPELAVAIYVLVRNQHVLSGLRTLYADAQRETACG